MSAPIIWDPEVLARMRQLTLRARQLVAGLGQGAHTSKRVARNVEFADYKEYTPGDPIRDLDWRVAARTDRLVVRRQQAETELAVTFVLDASADMATGLQGRSRYPDLERTKFGVAATLIATMAWYLQRFNEPLGLAILGGQLQEAGQNWIPARRGRNHLARIVTALAGLRPAGTEVLAEGFSGVGQRLVRRSTVIVISDLMEEPAHWGPQLAALGRRQVDLRIAHLYDPQEMDLDFKQATRFFSPEGGPALPIDPGAVRNPWRQIVQDYLTEVRQWLASRNALHVQIATNAPLEQGLSRLLLGV